MKAQPPLRLGVSEGRCFSLTLLDLSAGLSGRHFRTAHSLVP